MSLTFHLNRSGISARFRLRTGEGSVRVSVAIGFTIAHTIASPYHRFGGFMARKTAGLGERLERFSSWATGATGSTRGFTLAALMIVLWLLTGPIFRFSDTWQLVMNTITSIITFLMVFLIQRAQNKES